MLDDFEVIFSLDNLLLHVVLLDHLLYHQDRTMAAVLVDLEGHSIVTHLAGELLLQKKICCLLHTVLVSVVNFLN